MNRQFGFDVSYYQEVFRLLQGYTSESQMIACRLYVVFVFFLLLYNSLVAWFKHFNCITANKET